MTRLTSDYVVTSDGAISYTDEIAQDYSVPAQTPSLSLDFATDTYARNGAAYADFAHFLALTGSTFANASGGYAMDGSAVFGIDTPRLAGGLLLYEPASTNLIANPFDLSDASASHATRTATGIVDPTGALRGIELKEDGTTNIHQLVLQMASLAPADGRYAFSVFQRLKSGSAARKTEALLFNNGFSGQTSAFFDPAGSAAAGSTSAPFSSAAVGDYTAGNSFKRHKIMFNLTSFGTGAWIALQLFSTAAGSETYAGDGSSGMLYFGPKLEAAQASGYYASNPSSFAYGTRAADALTIAVPSGLSTLTVTFDDNTTQTINDATGSYMLPTTIDRPLIKSLVWS